MPVNRSRSYFLSLALVVVAVCISTKPTFAEGIYKWVDEQGAVHYSTEPHASSDRPAELPQIKREKIAEKIKDIQLGTPANCESHGGIDCTQGRDSDGSAICLDGFKDAVLPFNSNCLEARLKIQELTLSGPHEEQANLLSKPKPNLYTLNFVSKTVQMSVRNTSGVKALAVRADFTFPGGKRFIAEGPEDIEPFGAADYTLKLSMLSFSPSAADLTRMRYRLMCSNCR